jgi:dihydrofolate reductase
MFTAMQASVYIATSLDGFIARENDDLDWLHQGGSKPENEDYGYKAFFDSVDALVMGRNTYDVVRSFDPWPYGEKPVYVLSSRRLKIPPKLASSVTVTSGSVEEIVEELEAKGIRNIYVDGGATIQRFLASGAIQRLIISRIPVLIGKGIPLFGPLKRDIKLRHIVTRQYGTGLVQSEYEVLPYKPEKPARRTKR